MLRSSGSHILTTVAGSLPRPAVINQMLTDKVNHRPVDQATFEATLTEAVAGVVNYQVDEGLSIVSDGEMSKAHFGNYLNTRVTGYGGDVDLVSSLKLDDLADMPEIIQAVWGEAQFGLSACIGDITYTEEGRKELERDITNHRAALASAGAQQGFMTAPSPGVVAMLNPNRYYKTYEEYLFALAEAMKVEYRAITEAGLLLQIDAPDMGALDDLQTWMFSERETRGRQGLLELYVESLNVALEGIDPGEVRLHLCWANYMGPHTHDAPLETVLAPSFGVNCAGYTFEAANPAHAHEWRVFEDLKLPEGKYIVPGVIDTKSQVVENPQLVADRILRFAELVGPEQLMAGTDCGFGTAVGLGTVHPKVTWLKIKSLVEGAALASKTLTRTAA